MLSQFFTGVSMEDPIMEGLIASAYLLKINPNVSSFPQINLRLFSVCLGEIAKLPEELAAEICVQVLFTVQDQLFIENRGEKCVSTSNS